VSNFHSASVIDVRRKKQWLTAVYLCVFWRLGHCVPFESGDEWYSNWVRQGCDLQDVAFVSLMCFFVSFSEKHLYMRVGKRERESVCVCANVSVRECVSQCLAVFPMSCVSVCIESEIVKHNF
jgi:hypothetical protein